MTIAIIHGVGGFAGKHWMGWLYEKLVAEGHQVLMPTLPYADHPDRIEWLQETESLLKGFGTSELVLIGHSLGNATIMDFLEKQTRPVKGYISVAGYYENYFSPINDYFMAEKEIDIEKVKQNTKARYVIYGNNDPYVPQKTLQSLANGLGVKPIIIPYGGHLNTDAGFTTFPLLLDLVHTL